MNKSDVVKVIAKDLDLSQAHVTQVVDSLLSTVSETLAKKEDVRFIGFGTFFASKRKAYEGRNPQTGKKVTIPEAWIPKFRAGASLKDGMKK
jgi:DNA-binding protein HU-beta